jgi:hypothetical protein
MQGRNIVECSLALQRGTVRVPVREQVQPVPPCGTPEWGWVGGLSFARRGSMDRVRGHACSESVPPLAITSMSGTLMRVWWRVVCFCLPSGTAETGWRLRLPYRLPAEGMHSCSTCPPGGAVAGQAHAPDARLVCSPSRWRRFPGCCAFGQTGTTDYSTTGAIGLSASVRDGMLYSSRYASFVTS